MNSKEQGSLLAVEKIAPVSASAAESMTVRMVLYLVSIVPLGVGVGRMWGVGGFSLR